MLRRRNHSCKRVAAVMVETAVVLPVALLFLLAIIVGGMGIFYYQQVSFLACEGARWASVRGGDYERETDLTSPTQQQILENAILTRTVSMDPSCLSVHVYWVNQATKEVEEWDKALKDVRSVTALGEYVTNTVRVTVSYQWSPGVFFGTMTMTSTSEIPMAS